MRDVYHAVKDLQDDVDAAGTALTSAEVSAAVVTALNTAAPSSPTADSPYDNFKFMKRAILTVKEEILSRLSKIVQELIAAINRRN